MRTFTLKFNAVTSFLLSLPVKCNLNFPQASLQTCGLFRPMWWSDYVCHRATCNDGALFSFGIISFNTIAKKTDIQHAALHVVFSVIQQQDKRKWMEAIRQGKNNELWNCDKQMFLHKAKKMHKQRKAWHKWSNKRQTMTKARVVFRKDKWKCLSVHKKYL